MTTEITEVEVSNVMKIGYAKIQPQGATTIVGGNNEQGKTSFLDAIAMCIGGPKLAPAKPIKDGEDSAKINIKLKDDDSELLPKCIVQRMYYRTDDDKIRSSLSIVSDDEYNQESPRPQGILDDMVSNMTFDPLAFSKEKAAAQRETLITLVGLSFEQIDGKIDQDFEKRKGVNRNVKQLDGALKGMTQHTDALDALVDVPALMKELDEIRSHNQAIHDGTQDIRAQQEKLTQCNDHRDKLESEVEGAATSRTIRLTQAEARYNDEVKSINAEIDELIEEKSARVEKGKEMIKSLEEKIDSKTDEVGALGEPKPEADITQQINEAEAENQKIRDNEAWSETKANLTEEERKSQKLTDAIAANRKKKTTMVEEAEFPIEGLGFTEDGVSYKDIPLEQVSSAEALKVSTAIGLALNPRLPLLLIREGALLDEESLILVATMVAEKGGQVFIERVGEGSECHVIMKDGEASGEIVVTEPETASKE